MVSSLAIMCVTVESTLVKSLQVTTLAALHDLNLAAHYCDRLFLMQEGRIVAAGTPQEVLQPATIRAVYQVDAWVERHARTNQLQVTYVPLSHAGRANEPSMLKESRE